MLTKTVETIARVTHTHTHTHTHTQVISRNNLDLVSMPKINNIKLVMQVLHSWFFCT